MQTILGSGGAIGKELAKELPRFTNHIRLVSRHPKRINNADELFAADLTIRTSVLEAVKGSEIVYLVPGLPYQIKVWRSHWPVIMQNVIDACEATKAKLVFFDNVYLYDPKTIGNMTEENPIFPTSKKGKVRAQIAKMVTDAVETGKLTAMIVRSADFYGPGIQNSIILETVYKNLKKGKKANWIGKPEKIHSATFTPDAGRATALLGNTADAYNQVWHLPTDVQAITGRQWVSLFAEEMKVPAKVSILPGFMIRMLGIFNSFMRELSEMLYQNEHDYFFNSAKFRKRFPDFPVTDYREGVRSVVREGL